MPTTKSAKKRVRTSEKARQRNRSVKAGIRSARRNTVDAFESKDSEKSTQAFQKYCSILDKAAKKGVIKKNTAVRRKKRSAKKLSSVSLQK